MDDLRKRLYDRGGETSPVKRPVLTGLTTDVSRGWKDSPYVEPPKVVAPTPVERPVVIGLEELTDTSPELVIESTKKTSRKYRMIVLLGSIGLFVLIALVSSVYLFFGANQISAQNINISLSAPFSVAAGEKVLIQVNVSNQNTVPIESAMLILNYPSGTKTGDENVQDVYEERIAIDVLAPGEARNVPINVIIFGEENEGKEVQASIEYRVSGSNGTFFKDAEPIKIQISSSPLVVRVDAVEKVSSGQEVEVKITLQSNASTIQKNLLVSASFPNSFTFISSTPEPSYSQNEWLIDKIQPESSQVITVKGRVSGVANEVGEIQLSAGTSRSDNQFIMGSVLSKANASYTIERPFIDVVVDVNDDTDGSAVVEAGEIAEVKVLVTNTLEETIYDMRVEVLPKGNLIRDTLLSVPSGVYDSSSKTIRYEVSGTPTLSEVRSGETREFIFSVIPDIHQATGAFDISTKVFARRVNETNATEAIVGTAVAEVKYSSRV